MTRRSTTTRTTLATGLLTVAIVATVAAVTITGASGEATAPARATAPDTGVAMTAAEVRIARPGDVPPVADGLSTPTVLSLRVVGFDSHDVATAAQCRRASTGTRCANEIPVQFRASGVATFQYLVSDEVVSGPGEGCRGHDPPCFVTITSWDGQRRAELQTVFVDRLPPQGTVSVTPRGRLEQGQLVTVEVTGLPPGTDAVVTTCVASFAGRARCGAPAPEARLVVGSDGTGRTQLQVTASSVGPRGSSCDRDARCAITVLTDRADARVAPVPIRVAPPPGAAYDSTRTALGLLVAALLLATATWLVRDTDWSPVGDAEAPEIDEAEYADLDRIIAALPDPDPDLLHPDR